MKKLLIGLSLFGVCGLVYLGFIEAVNAEMNKRTMYQPHYHQAVMVEQNRENDMNKNCEKAEFYLTYYNPLRDGINCDEECETTASGIRIISNGEKRTDYWFDGIRGGVACPREYPFGTIFKINEIELVCIDRGGAIVDGKQTRLDILYDDGMRDGDKGYKNPKTHDGKVLAGVHEGYICKK
ncbi:MAG: hypothetical protein N3D75_03140 [Candidatus Aenigmarchaeota archaeon]|nr:hypothetical protein [Candidatus Aenigmarchaeota archaeon]